VAVLVRVVRVAVVAVLVRVVRVAVVAVLVRVVRVAVAAAVVGVGLVLGFAHPAPAAYGAVTVSADRPAVADGCRPGRSRIGRSGAGTAGRLGTRLVVMSVVVLTGHLTDYPCRAPAVLCESVGMRVAALFTYPIKSCYRNERHEVSVEPWGFAGDRRWIVVDAANLKQITQREVPELGRIIPQETAEGLRLHNTTLGELDVPAPAGGPLVPVEIWRRRVLGSPAGPDADAFVSKVVGQDARLVYLDDPTRRPVDPEYARARDRVSFADGFPVLVTNTASLAALNDWLVEDQEEPIVMNRFRPNLVVEGAAAWAEDGWLGRRLRIGKRAEQTTEQTTGQTARQTARQTVFRVVKPCDRCVLTTVDPETGEKGRQPLRILSKQRRFLEGLLFGVNLIPDNTGIIRVGDPVDVI
jgi:uncharacterized protein YcbX